MPESHTRLFNALSGIISVEEALLDSRLEKVLDTREEASSSITGAISVSALEDGKLILLKLSKSTSADSTLNLTLQGNSSTGAIPVYLNNTDRLGEGFSARDWLLLVYTANAGPIARRWTVIASSDNKSAAAPEVDYGPIAIRIPKITTRMHFIIQRRNSSNEWIRSIDTYTQSAHAGNYVFLYDKATGSINAYSSSLGIVPEKHSESMLFFFPGSGNGLSFGNYYRYQFYTENDIHYDEEHEIVLDSTKYIAGKWPSVSSVSLTESSSSSPSVQTGDHGPLYIQIPSSTKSLYFILQKSADGESSWTTAIDSDNNASMLKYMSNNGNFTACGNLGQIPQSSSGKTLLVDVSNILSEGDYYRFQFYTSDDVGNLQADKWVGGKWPSVPAVDISSALSRISTLESMLNALSTRVDDLEE